MNRMCKQVETPKNRVSIKGTQKNKKAIGSSQKKSFYTRCFFFSHIFELVWWRTFSYCVIMQQRRRLVTWWFTSIDVNQFFGLIIHFIWESLQALKFGLQLLTFVMLSSPNQTQRFSQLNDFVHGEFSSRTFPIQGTSIFLILLGNMPWTSCSILNWNSQRKYYLYYSY